MSEQQSLLTEDEIRGNVRPMGNHQAYAVRLGDKFCRFGSYSAVTLKQNPLAASLFMREQDAKKRLRKHYLPSGEPVAGIDFKVVKLRMVWEVLS